MLRLAWEVNVKHAVFCCLAWSHWHENCITESSNFKRKNGVMLMKSEKRQTCSDTENSSYNPNRLEISQFQKYCTDQVWHLNSISLTFTVWIVYLGSTWHNLFISSTQLEDNNFNSIAHSSPRRRYLSDCCRHRGCRWRRGPRWHLCVGSLWRRLHRTVPRDLSGSRTVPQSWPPPKTH